ncbi:hypothetical protein [Bradyrhizobium erythrophlei]|jgi:hypothetical protein|uniref:Uncharacterized protein n=1 Tax=Bradyrhizobium erythrophlei TaxID=1437360 RepID=A0A1M7UC32_9BRAD|nr:hypothetical protein [Bradyrhizobium erythrophlei]SHN80496.1 hypothetical protein SAMN05444170_4371 [Bradyrhizobium erythrophlei]
MPNKIDELLPTAKEIQKKAAVKEAETAEEQRRCPEVRLSRRSGPNTEQSLIYLKPQPDDCFDGLPKEIVGRSDSRPASQV